MKYSSSIRMINAVVFALIFIAFGCLGCYFSFFVCPDFFAPSGSSQANNFIGNTGYNFALQFGVLGLAVMLIAVLGFVLSLKSIRQQNDDKIVKASFLCYVAIGYVFCVFFFLNSVLLYRLIGKDQIAWWIIVSIILLIGSLIASNVPMMKMLEDSDSNIILTVLTATFAIVLFPLGLTLGLTYLVTLGASTNVGVIRTELLVYLAITFVAFLLSLFAAIVFFKNYKKGVQTKLPHLLADIGMIATSGLFFSSSSFEYVYRKTSSATYYNSLQGTSRAYAGLDYVIMGYIVGSLLVIGAAVLLVSNLVGDKKPAPKKAA
jgi:hypothetical protein